MSILKKIVTEKLKRFSRSYSSYTKEGEDRIAREFFQNLSNGFYIDVEAYDPVPFSNTMYFYNLGWKGINIETSPDSVKKFKKSRHRDININCGISDQEGHSLQNERKPKCESKTACRCIFGIPREPEY